MRKKEEKIEGNNQETKQKGKLESRQKETYKRK